MRCQVKVGGIYQGKFNPSFFCEVTKVDSSAVFYAILHADGHADKGITNLMSFELGLRETTLEEAVLIKLMQ